MLAVHETPPLLFPGKSRKQKPESISSNSGFPCRPEGSSPTGTAGRDRTGQDSSAETNVQPCRASLGTHSNARLHLISCQPGAYPGAMPWFGSFPVLDIYFTPKRPRLPAATAVLSSPTVNSVKAGSYTSHPKWLTSTRAMPKPFVSQNSCGPGWVFPRGENQGRSSHSSFGIRNSACSAATGLQKASTKHRHLREQGQCPKIMFKTGFCTEQCSK